MGTPPITDESIRAAVAAYAKNGSNQSRAAAALGISRESLQRRLGMARDKGLMPADGEPAPIVRVIDTSDPIKLRAANDENARLRLALKDAERRTADAENHRAHVLRLTPEPARIQPNFRRGDGKGHGRQAVVLHLSDLHVGETVERSEVSNVNSYDLPTAQRRVGRLFETASVLMTSAWPASDGAPERVYVLLGGDLISGHGLHPEHAETDAGTAFEQVKWAAEYISGGLLALHGALKARFKKPVEIHVISVVGNHGRSTFGKPRTKLVTLQSYDALVGDFVEASLRHIPTIRHFQPRGFDAYFDVAGWPALLTHGDRMGSGGGTGFIGPMATIIKGHRKIVDTEYRQRRPVRWVFSGHFHTTGVTPFGFANGSGVGYGEYAKSLRADPEPAQQNYMVFHERYGLLRWHPIVIGASDEGTIYDGSHQMILPVMGEAAE
jgi:transposase-like protein